MTKRAHQAKFARLKNGQWGLRVTGPQADKFEGRTIPVTKRGGEEVEMTTSKMLWTGDTKWGRAAIYSIARKAKTTAASEEAAAPADHRYGYDRETAEYMAGRNEVAQIQAISAPGSALREQLYMEMEMRNYNLGLDG